MAIRVENFSEALVAAVRQVARAHTDLLDAGLSINVDAIDVQVNLIAPNGEGALKLDSIQATPVRRTTSVSPAVVETTTQTQGSELTTETPGQQVTIEETLGDQIQRTDHGRETIVTTDYQE